MQQNLDPRLVQVGITINGQTQVFPGSTQTNGQNINPQGFNITATGTKYANSLQNECEIRISNLKKDTQNYILTETSPFNLNKTPKIAFLDAGRQSYGMTRVFSGNIISSSLSPPPDTTIVLKCLTGNYSKGKLISVNQGATARLSNISQQAAENLGLTLNFQAKDKTINNYTFSGDSLSQVNKIGEAGNIDAYVDNDTLIVKDARVPLTNTLTIVNLNTGMVTIPELTEQGIKVVFLLDGQTALGGSMQVTSVQYPSVNGVYVIYKLGFEITSRDTAFYWIAEGIRR